MPAKGIEEKRSLPAKRIEEKKKEVIASKENRIEENKGHCQQRESKRRKQRSLPTKKSKRRKQRTLPAKRTEEKKTEVISSKKN